MASDFEARIRNVTAVLGPTNTGKTHLAIERMLAHQSGMIGLPLRLLAREVYDKIQARVGADKVALITGEEKIKPDNARYWVSTVEAMPRNIDVEFLAIDEIQLCADPERGHVFTDRLLHARGASETLLLGAQTMREAIQELIPGANFIARPRLSKLTYSGEKKITRLPARTAIVAFSAQDVYAIAELIRRQHGGAAVVLGALSPRTRNAQVALYQSGDVEFLVATDAIGMGLNLDVDHVAFSAIRKFDGQNHRNLTAGEIGQIAGRAGRYMNDGTFGVTGSCEPLDAELVERLETHSFEPVRVLQWRNRKLDFSTLNGLYDSLREYPRETRLARARTADDLAALEAAMSDREITDMASTPAAVERLWDVCQVPDYRKISGQSHNELVATLYKFVAGGDSQIPEDWFARQVALADRTDGDIDTLATRIAHIRTWTFVANRPDWLKDPGHWQAKTRSIEDSLSDALHERLTQRFVDRRTSALMKGMRDKDELNADIAEDGAITVENHYVGRLKGFRFTLDSAEDGIHGKATRAAATQVLTRELGMRARRVAAAQNDALRLDRNGHILWRDDEIAELQPAEDPLAPTLTLLTDEHLSEADREKVQKRLEKWLSDLIAEKLKPLVDMSTSTELQGLARGIAFRLKENFGVLKRELVSDEINALDQTARAELRKFGLRFGAFNIFFPAMLKPASADLASALWALKNRQTPTASGEAPPEPQLPRPGLTSVAAESSTPDALYRAAGFHVCGPRAVRLDILERLADLIRPLLAWRADPSRADAPPKGSTGDGAFRTTDDMMSILGCSAEELSKVLKALGFRSERRRIAPSPQVPASVAETAEPAMAGAPSDGSANGELAEPVSEAPAEGVTSPGDATETAPAEAPAPEITAGDAVTTEAATDGPSEADATSDAVNEEEFEEIWRPRRHPRPERGRGRHRGERNSDAARASQPPSLEGAPATDGEKHHGNQRRGRDHHRDGRKQFGGGQHAGQGEGKPAQGDADGRSRGQHRHGAPRQNKTGDGSRNDGGRQDRRGDRNRREERRRTPEVITSAPPKRAGADPDSPFAALAALKANMNKSGDNGGSR